MEEAILGYFLRLFGYRPSAPDGKKITSVAGNEVTNFL